MSPVHATAVLASTLNAGLCVMGLAMVLCFVRLLRGPSLCDRVIALDLLLNLAVGVIAIHALNTGRTVFLYVVIVTALIAFLATMGFVYYIERRRAL